MDVVAKTRKKTAGEVAKNSVVELQRATRNFCGEALPVKGVPPGREEAHHRARGTVEALGARSIGGLGKNRRGLGRVAVPHHSRESTEIRSGRGVENSRAPTTVRSTETHPSSGDCPAPPAQNSASPSSRLQTSVGTTKMSEGVAKPRYGVLTEEVG
ncbi:hypothetical protein TNCV_2024791 [Trichonephila clavipes]|nr:hypothetical protein TNCV_2024791 [Trichonephila clavipes]